MDCLTIGTGGMMPLPERYLNSLMVRLDGTGYLFDCGEGTQVAMKRWRTGFRHIRVLAVTHLHGDHVLGIPGLLMCRTHAGAEEPLVIVGPVGIRRFIENTLTDLRYHISFPIHFEEVDPKTLNGEKIPATVYQDNLCVLKALPLEHGTPCLGYRLEEHERPGRFHPGKAKELGIPEGPSWGKLQKGQSVTLETGTVVTPEDVLGPSRRGRHMAMVTDTKPCKNVYRLTDSVDAAFVEGMFSEVDFEKAEDKAHMTVKKAARITKRSGAVKTVLFHISPRYKNGDLDTLQAEALEENPAAEIGRDGKWYEVPLPEK